MTLILLQAGNPLIQFFPLVLIIIVFYFFMIRPQVKRQKDQQKFIDSLEKGTEVVSNSGIIGRINKIEGGIITLQIAEKTFIRITKSSISKEMTEAFAGGTDEKDNNG